MRDRLISHWRGLALSLVGVAAVGWLAATGRLGLYIHPRYFVFTIVMVAIAAVVTVAAFAVLPSVSPDEAHDGHDHGEPPRSPLRRRLSAGATVAVIVVAAIAMLAIPPTTLTSSTAENRAINAGAGGAASDAPPTLAGADQSRFTVKDWAGMLRQGADAQSLADASPTLTGFVIPDADDPENVFYVARFVVTCCAVDAQPVGVPVYLPGWQQQHPVDSWVEVTGGFVENPSLDSMQLVALEPATVTSIDQPADPYVY